jgi:hypothetical protein
MDSASDQKSVGSVGGKSPLGDKSPFREKTGSLLASATGSIIRARNILLGYSIKQQEIAGNNYNASTPPRSSLQPSRKNTSKS